ncbi:MAG: LAGLIDADG family homing endonuclease [archaeon]
MNCLSLSALIMTSEGLKKITEIKKGDKIYALNQKTYKLVLKKCTGVFDNGKKKVFELGTLHHSIRATSNHPFLVLKRNGRGKQNNFVWKILSEIKTGDEIVVLKHLNINKSHKFKAIKKSKVGDYKVTKVNKVILPKKSSPELMEYLGLYVGDGWIRAKRGEVGFALPRNTNGRKRLMQLYPTVFEGKINSFDGIYVYVNSVNLARFIDSLGFGSGAKNKTIPEWVFTLPEKEKEAFVEGLMLSDGYKNGNSWRYVSSSKELLARLRLLLQTMNYRVGKIHCQRKKKDTQCVKRKLLKDSEYGYICFSRRDKWNVEKYPNQYKYQNFLIKNNNFETEKVQYKKFVKTEPTLDLRVEGEHNFIADGIVVHNTGIQRSSSTPFMAQTTTTPAGKKIHGKIEPKKPIPFIVASHGVRYVATASIANVTDLYNKAIKALSIRGPTFLLVFSSCPTGWRHESETTIEVARKAILTRAFPVYEIENGELKFTQRIEKPLSVKEYLSMQGRFKHLTEEEITKVQGYVNERYEFLLGLEGKGKVFDVLY